MNINKTQVIVILGAIGVVVLLLLANTKLPEKSTSESTETASSKTDVVLNQFITENKNALAPTDQQDLASLEANLDNGSADEYDNVIRFWEKQKNAILAAYYAEKKATSFPSEKNWEETAGRYFKAVRFSNETLKPELFKKATKSFENVLTVNPNNIDAKIDLAKCYVEGSPQPMKGIGLLREVEKTDSNSVKLQLAFAEFSVKSGQIEKAITRYKKVLSIDPKAIDSYLHLADIYRQQGDVHKVIENLEQYASKTDNLEAKTEVEGYIDQLKH